ncbi:hypothetical protein ABEB36_009204 [Hypothenemus hampei]|uniref:Uncharacterized protein n=1 Tax=Hypothenemus hampei TaxID=57062 RepID=A0ABD1ETG1_HYPHA
MQLEFSQVIPRLFLFAIFFVSLASVMGKPPNFQETASPQVFNNDPDPVINNNLDSVFRPWQLEFIAQRMAELNQLGQMNNLNGQEYGGGFERALRSERNEIKRQSRYRLCYFNPVSCFKK